MLPCPVGVAIILVIVAIHCVCQNTKSVFVDNLPAASATLRSCENSLEKVRDGFVANVLKFVENEDAMLEQRSQQAQAFPAKK